MKKFEVKRYEKIINKLVKSSFPILRKKKINIKKVLFPTFYRYSASATINLFKKPFIYINPKYCKYYNNFELKGVFAHELCHLEDFLTNNYRWFFVNGLKYSFSKDYKEKYEKETDKKTICKGYRKELKAQREKRKSKIIKDKNYEKNKRFYLSPEEIDKVVCKKHPKTT